MAENTCTDDQCLNRGARGGLCRRCRRRRHYLANRDHELATMANWRAANYAYDKARQRAFYRANLEYFQDRYQANREEILRRHRERRASNPGGDSHYSREWRKRNPERWALRNRENQRRRRSDKPVNYAAILAEHGMVCHLDGEPIASLDDLHFDHVIPLAKGGAHVADNIRPAHALCNIRKGDKIA